MIFCAQTLLMENKREKWKVILWICFQFSFVSGNGQNFTTSRGGEVNCFGTKAMDLLNTTSRFTNLIRAHEVQEVPFFFFFFLTNPSLQKGVHAAKDSRVVTVFSSNQGSNSASICIVNDKIIQPFVTISFLFKSDTYRVMFSKKIGGDQKQYSSSSGESIPQPYTLNSFF